MEINSQNIEFGEIRVKLPELRIWFRDDELFLSLTQIRLLMVFLADPYRHYSTEELIASLQLTSRGALWTLVCRLREMLNNEYIVAVPGTGYAFARESYSQNLKIT